MHQIRLPSAGFARRSAFAIVVSMAMLGLVAAPVSAAAPGNDNFANAVVLGASGTVAGTNIDATAETDEPLNWGSESMTVWYSWTPASNAWVIFTTLLDETETQPLVDTTLAVFTGTSVDALMEVTRNDDCCGSNQSRVMFNAVAATTYRIQVAGYYGQNGTFTLEWGPDITLPTLWASVIKVQGAKVTVAFSASDDMTGISSVECRLSGGTYAGCSSPYVAQLPRGSYTFYVRATDGAGNQAETTRTFVIKSGKIKGF